MERITIRFAQKDDIVAIMRFLDENWKKDLVGLTISSIPVAVDMAAIHSQQDILREIDEQNELGMRYADLSLGNNGVTPGKGDRMIVVYEAGFDMIDEGIVRDCFIDKYSQAYAASGVDRSRCTISRRLPKVINRAREVATKLHMI